MASQSQRTAFSSLALVAVWLSFFFSPPFPIFLPFVFLRQGQDLSKLPKLVYNFLSSSDRPELVVSPLPQFPE